jgi:hypothetical protein
LQKLQLNDSNGTMDFINQASDKFQNKMKNLIESLDNVKLNNSINNPMNI